MHYLVVSDQHFPAQIVDKIVECGCVRGKCIIVVKAEHFNLLQVELVVGVDRGRVSVCRQGLR